MKKFVSLVLSLVMVAACMCSPAFAAEIDEVASATQLIFMGAVDNGNRNILRASASDYDLGTNGSLPMTITDFTAGSTRQSDYNYNTNSTKIKITMKSDIAISVRVTLYDANNDSMVQQSTVTVNTSNTSVTFSNLTSAKKYFIKYENLGQQEVDITGTIAAK